MKGLERNEFFFMRGVKISEFRSKLDEIRSLHIIFYLRLVMQMIRGLVEFHIRRHKILMLKLCIITCYALQDLINKN